MSTPWLPRRYEWLGRHAAMTATFGLLSLMVLIDWSARQPGVGLDGGGAGSLVAVAWGLVVAATAFMVVFWQVSARLTFWASSAVAVLTLALSVYLYVSPPGSLTFSGFTSSETTGAVLLIGAVARRCTLKHVAVGAGVLMTALILGPPLREGGFDLTGMDLWGYAGIGVAGAGVGLYLRSLHSTHARQVADARRQERLALARDLHDTASHHITSIVVQTQALRHVARRNPGAGTEALADIETAAGAALAAMRDVVATLRDGSEEPPRWPSESCRLQDVVVALRDLVSASPGEPPACLHVAGGGTDLTVPAKVATAIFRITQESLANVRRHAHHPTQVSVELRADPGRLALTVCDDGRGSSLRRHLGGYGLVGMSERVALLGGTFTAGPSGGRGWEVRVDLPTMTDAL